MSDTSPSAAAPVRAPLDALNIVALITAGAVTIGGLAAVALHVEVAAVAALCGPVIGGCMAMIQRSGG